MEYNLWGTLKHFIPGAPFLTSINAKVHTNSLITIRQIIFRENKWLNFKLISHDQEKKLWMFYDEIISILKNVKKVSEGQFVYVWSAPSSGRILNLVLLTELNEWIL